MDDRHDWYEFLMDAADAPDALVRVLTVLAVQPLDITGVTMTRGDHSCSIHVGVRSVEPARVETLRRRLEGLSVVRSVGLSWGSAQNSTEAL
jgi:acetolactate synthase regulatory subunit